MTSPAPVDTPLIAVLVEIANLNYYLSHYYEAIGDIMNQPFFCFDLGGYTTGNSDCNGCGRCGNK